jgi:tRNA (guanine37-N1)-methyltransferase
METMQAALSFLERDRLLYHDMRELLMRGLGEVVHAGPDGVLLREKEGGTCFLAGANAEDDLRLAAQADGELLTLHRLESAQALLEQGRWTGFQDCWQAVYLGEAPREPEEDLRILGPEYLETVHAHYHPEKDGAYLLDRLEQRTMLGVFVEDQLAGFIGTHSEGSIGMLEVFPAYRRQGLASALERGMMFLQMRQGWQPYGHIIVGNDASLALQKKLGLTVAEGHVYWLY